MKELHLFLASSINDLHRERMELGDFIRTVNDQLILSDAYVYIHMCEDISDEIAKTRKQDEYNDVIRSCQQFYLMLWRKIGGYTIEELDVALAQQQTAGAPEITVCFREPEGGRPADVQAFLDRMAAEGRAVLPFDSVDDIKRAMLRSICAQPGFPAEVTVRDGRVLLNGGVLPGLAAK